jgi:hypothetical protein
VDRATYRQFVGALEAEILRRMREDRDHYISRTEIEDIGERAGMARVVAAHVFLLQAGSSWAGEIIPEGEGDPLPLYAPKTSVLAWNAVVLDAEWFRGRGKSGPPEEVWEHVRDTAVPFHPIIYGLESELRKQAIREAVEGYRRYYDGQKVNPPASIVLASGVR